MAKKTETKTEKIEREYVIPLRKQVKKVPRYKKANKAIRTIKEFLARHMKVYDRDLSKIKISKYLNEIMWAKGIKKPLMKVKVKVIKEGDIVRAEPAEMPDKLKFKKLRERKIESAAKDIAKKRKAEKKEAKEEVEKQIGEQEVNEEKKKETEEKKEAVIEAGKEMEKANAKKEKHTTKVKSPKQEKNARTGYNKSSRGH